MIGPTTTPAIQVLLFDGGLGVDDCSVDCGVLGLDGVTLAELVEMLENVGVADVAPMEAISTKTLISFSLETYYWTGTRQCWTC